MKHRATPAFWKAYRRLPDGVRAQANKSYALLKENPHHQSLRLKKVGRLWSVRVSKGYRALAVENEGRLVWFWIGSHADYDAMI